MQRHRQALVLDQQPRVPGGEGMQLAAHAIELRGRAVGLLDLAPWRPALEPVEPRGGQPERAEQAIERRQLAAADQRQRAVETVVEAGQHADHLRVHRNLVRRLGDLDQGAVDVEEKRPVVTRLG